MGEVTLGVSNSDGFGPRLDTNGGEGGSTLVSEGACVELERASPASRHCIPGCGCCGCCGCLALHRTNKITLKVDPGRGLHALVKEIRSAH